MRLWPLLLSLPLVAAESAPNTLTPAEKAAGWILLFDGRTSAGWIEVSGKPFPDTWAVEGGCLRTLPPSAGAQDIRTVEEFGSFELKFEWKMDAHGNSGVKYLIPRMDEWVNQNGRQARARGLEYQLADNSDEVPKKDPSRAAAALYSVLAPEPLLMPRLGEFNESRLVVREAQVEHWLNGVRVVQFDLDKVSGVAALRGGPPPKRSPISLQHHSTPVWFRNLKVRRLDTSASLQ